MSAADEIRKTIAASSTGMIAVPVHRLESWLAELGRMQSAYSDGYADGYGRGQAGDPPYVEPNWVEDQGELEYGWAGDAQATTFYATQEEAEEFMGSPKRFARTKAGPWRETPPPQTIPAEGETDAQR